MAKEEGEMQIVQFQAVGDWIYWLNSDGMLYRYSPTGDDPGREWLDPETGHWHDSPSNHPDFAE